MIFLNKGIIEKRNLIEEYSKILIDKIREGVSFKEDYEKPLRGNKIIVTGIKKDDIFIAKKYSRTPYHLVELIEQIDGNEIITRGERLEEIIND